MSQRPNVCVGCSYLLCNDTGGRLPCKVLALRDWPPGSPACPAGGWAAHVSTRRSPGELFCLELWVAPERLRPLDYFDTIPF